MRIYFIIISILLIAGMLASLLSTNKLTRFCLYTPLKVFLISLGLALILWSVSDKIFGEAEIKEYVNIDNKDLFFYPFFICFSCAVVSYSIFLCKIRVVRKSFFLSFLSFFFLPLFFLFLNISDQGVSKEYYVQTVFYSLSFILPQVYFFIDFRKKNRKGDWLN